KAKKDERKIARTDRKLEKAELKGKTNKADRLTRKLDKRLFHAYCKGSRSPEDPEDFDLSNEETQTSCCKYLKKQLTLQQVAKATGEAAIIAAQIVGGQIATSAAKKIGETAVQKAGEAAVKSAAEQGAKRAGEQMGTKVASGASERAIRKAGEAAFKETVKNSSDAAMKGAIDGAGGKLARNVATKALTDATKEQGWKAAQEAAGKAGKSAITKGVDWYRGDTGVIKEMDDPKFWNKAGHAVEDSTRGAVKGQVSKVANMPQNAAINRMAENSQLDAENMAERAASVGHVAGDSRFAGATAGDGTLNTIATVGGYAGTGVGMVGGAVQNKGANKHAALVESNTAAGIHTTARSNTGMKVGQGMVVGAQAASAIAGGLTNTGEHNFFKNRMTEIGCE
ncbi:MAG: hypothetical protein AAB425_06955, partial [Bdellovibrionota bacterium]